MSFVQSTYVVDETDESVEIEMILSNQSSIDVVVQVTSSDMQAIGKHLANVPSLLKRVHALLLELFDDSYLILNVCPKLAQF